MACTKKVPEVIFSEMTTFVKSCVEILERSGETYKTSKEWPDLKEILFTGK